jgi:hypothetical protein
LPDVQELPINDILDVLAKLIEMPDLKEWMVEICNSLSDSNENHRFSAYVREINKFYSPIDEIVDYREIVRSYTQGVYVSALQIQKKENTEDDILRLMYFLDMLRMITTDSPLLDPNSYSIVKELYPGHSLNQKIVCYLNDTNHLDSLIKTFFFYDNMNRKLSIDQPNQIYEQFLRGGYSLIRHSYFLKEDRLCILQGTVPKQINPSNISGNSFIYHFGNVSFIIHGLTGYNSRLFMGGFEANREYFEKYILEKYNLMLSHEGEKYNLMLSHEGLEEPTESENAVDLFTSLMEFIPGLIHLLFDIKSSGLWTEISLWLVEFLQAIYLYIPDSMDISNMLLIRQKGKTLEEQLKENPQCLDWKQYSNQIIQNEFGMQVRHMIRYLTSIFLGIDPLYYPFKEEYFSNDQHQDILGPRFHHEFTTDQKKRLVPFCFSTFFQVPEDSEDSKDSAWLKNMMMLSLQKYSENVIIVLTESRENGSILKEHLRYLRGRLETLIPHIPNTFSYERPSAPYSFEGLDRDYVSMLEKSVLRELEESYVRLFLRNET